MIKSLKDLKRAKTDSFNALRGEVERLAKGSSFKDDSEDYWSLTVDKAGNGKAVIRFLPAPAGETIPFVRYWHHFFQGPKKKMYVEMSRTTLGEDDPVSELNSALWNSGVEKDKDIARAQKRKLTYVANILVVEDPASPQNEGKVFLFKFGKKIFDFLKSATDPLPEYEGGPVPAPINPFDMWEGVNFKLRARKADGYRSYDLSKFSSEGEDENFRYLSSPIAETDEEIEEIWGQTKPLQPLVDPKLFKPYDVLKKKLYDVLDLGSIDDVKAETESEADEDVEEVEEVKPKATKPKATKPKATKKVVEEETSSETDEDEIDFLALASDDE